MKKFHPFLFASALFLSSRLFCGIFVYLGHARRIATGSHPEGGWEGVANWWLNPWTTYDSLHFISIAREGYDAFRTPFFPLYPILLKLGGPSLTGMAVAGIILSNVFFLLSLWLLFKLSEKDLKDRPRAKAVVWLVAFFPTTAFFSAVYTESLFLFFLVACFLSVRNQRWILAGVCGMVAALTRNPGFLISLALFLEYCSTHSWHPRHWRAKEMLALSLPLVAFLAVQGYFAIQFGDVSAGIASQEIYFRKIGWPWEPIWHDILWTTEVPDTVLVGGSHLFFTLFAIAQVWIVRRQLPPSYSVLIIGVLLMHLTFYRTLYPQTIGTIRYLSTLFPFSEALVLLMVKCTSSFRRFMMILYLYLFCIYSYGFGLKGFLG